MRSSRAAAASSARGSSSGSSGEGHEVSIARRRDYDLTAMDDDRDASSTTPRPSSSSTSPPRSAGSARTAPNPGRYWYANLMMGAHVLEQARLHATPKLVIAGTICAYPKFAPVPFREEDLWNGYPEETNAPYGVAKKAILVGAQSYREQYGTNAIFLLPVNLYGPGDNFDLETSHVIPALIRKMVEAQERGDDEIVLWGDGTPTREFLYVDDCVEGLALAAERYDGAEPVNLGTGEEIAIRDLAELVARRDGLRGRRSVGTRRSRTASRGVGSTRRAPRSCSASGRPSRCARGSRARSPGTASTPDEHGGDRRPPPPPGARNARRGQRTRVTRHVVVALGAIVVGPDRRDRRALLLDQPQRLADVPGRRPDLARHVGLAARGTGRSATRSRATAGRCSWPR